MAIGNQTTQAAVNAQIGQFAVALHSLMSQIMGYQAWLTALGQSGLENLGFDASDAQAVITAVNYMSTVAGCYFGTVQQGGIAGSGAIDFDFDNALIGLTGGAT